MCSDGPGAVGFFVRCSVRMRNTRCINPKCSKPLCNIPYILESNPHPFYSFRGQKNQMRIRFAVVSYILEKR